MIDSVGHRWSTNTSEVTNEHVFPPTSSEDTILEQLNVKSSTVYETSPTNACNIDSSIISNTSSESPLRQSSTNHNQDGIDQTYHPLSDFNSTESARDNHVNTTYSNMVSSLPETSNEFQNMIGDNETTDDEEYEEEDDDDENEVDGDDESYDEAGDLDDDDEDEGDEDDDESENSEDIVDPGQHCQIVNQHALSGGIDNFVECDGREPIDILDGERMLEVTRKLVRSTERDPDRDLRKQVLLKTAIKKLPHFMDYHHYSDSLERCPNENISPQNYYESHDSQQKFYHPVQPNSIQMSTTSLRMLDLNDDHDPELINIEQEQDPHLGYNARASLEQHDYVQNQYDRYHHRTTHDPTQYDPNNHMISRHNSLDNLYQPISGGDLSADIKDGDERIPIAFQIACEIYDFTCNPDDNDRKLLDNLAHDYYPPKPTKETKLDANVVAGRDGLAPDDQDGSDGGSNSNSSTTSTTDESASSSISNCSVEQDEITGTSLLETSLNPEHSDFYHSSHDSGVALFSPRTNKRSSSSIGLDDEMEIDHLTELPNPGIASNNQYKKLRKRETID